MGIEWDVNVNKYMWIYIYIDSDIHIEVIYVYNVIVGFIASCNQKLDWHYARLCHGLFVLSQPDKKRWTVKSDQNELYISLFVLSYPKMAWGVTVLYIVLHRILKRSHANQRSGLYILVIHLGYSKKKERKPSW